MLRSEINIWDLWYILLVMAFIALFYIGYRMGYSKGNEDKCRNRRLEARRIRRKRY